MEAAEKLQKEDAIENNLVEQKKKQRPIRVSGSNKTHTRGCLPKESLPMIPQRMKSVINHTPHNRPQ